MTTMTPERLAEIRRQLDAAHEMVAALCRPRGSEGAREWEMSIPARPGHDPDIVIADGLGAARDLLAALDERDAEIARLRADLLDAYALADGMEREADDVCAFCRATIDDPTGRDFSFTGAAGGATLRTLMCRDCADRTMRASHD